ncbi:MAG: Hsp20/alpha crystallin family protein [Candidatus Aminicenantes bacterium]|nr:Hsp20/alpha crystallin family protein [Candidatus Aminicenantes bacterium]
MAKKKFSFSEIEIGKNFSSRISTHVDWEPNTNIIEAGDLLIIEIELPGVDKDDVSIVMQGESELIIRGTKHQPRLHEPQVTYYLFEREFGTFYKRIIIDFPLDSAKIETNMKEGVLMIQIPKKKSAKVSVDIK